MKLSVLFAQPKVKAALESIRGAFTPEVLAALDPEHQEAGRALAELSLSSAIAGADEEDATALAAVEQVLSLCSDSTRLLALANGKLTTDLTAVRGELATSLNQFTELDGRVKSGALIAADAATAAADLKVQSAVKTATDALLAAQKRLATRTEVLAQCGLENAPFLDADDDTAFETARLAAVARKDALTAAGFSLNADNRPLLFADQPVFDAALALAKPAAPERKAGNPLAAPKPGGKAVKVAAA